MASSSFQRFRDAIARSEATSRAASQGGDVYAEEYRNRFGVYPKGYTPPKKPASTPSGSVSTESKPGGAPKSSADIARSTIISTPYSKSSLYNSFAKAASDDADKDKIRGMGFTGLWMDEASEFDKEVYRKLSEHRGKSVFEHEYLTHPSKGTAGTASTTAGTGIDPWKDKTPAEILEDIKGLEATAKAAGAFATGGFVTPEMIRAGTIDSETARIDQENAAYMAILRRETRNGLIEGVLQRLAKAEPSVFPARCSLRQVASMARGQFQEHWDPLAILADILHAKGFASATHTISTDVSNWLLSYSRQKHDAVVAFLGQGAQPASAPAVTGEQGEDDLERIVADALHEPSADAGAW